MESFVYCHSGDRQRRAKNLRVGQAMLIATTTVIASDDRSGMSE